MESAHLHLDTHRIVKNLESRGFTEEQAEGGLQAIEEIRLVGVSTKEDIANIRQDLKQTEQSLRQDFQQIEKSLRLDFQHLRDDGKSELNALRTEMYKALFYQAFAVVGLTVTLLKFLG